VRRPRARLRRGTDGAARRVRRALRRVRVRGAGVRLRHFGDSGGQPRQLLDIGKQLDDWRAAIAFARSLPEVDADRIVAWGSSFSGGHVAVIAAEDARLAAAISQNPFMDGIWALRAAGPANCLRLTAAGLRDEWARLLRRPPYELAIVGPPGSVAVMTSPDAEPGYRGMFPPGETFVNHVAGRIALRVGLYRPGRRAAQIRCPWLVQVAVDDAVTPPQPAVAAAGRAPRGQVCRYEGGHFDVYAGEVFERAVADQIAFMRRVVPGVTEPAAVRS
jgi:uncharacterized protein